MPVLKVMIDCVDIHFAIKTTLFKEIVALGIVFTGWVVIS